MTSASSGDGSTSKVVHPFEEDWLHDLHHRPMDHLVREKLRLKNLASLCRGIIHDVNHEIGAGLIVIACQYISHNFCMAIYVSKHSLNSWPFLLFLAGVVYGQLYIVYVNDLFK